MKVKLDSKNVWYPGCLAEAEQLKKVAIEVSRESERQKGKVKVKLDSKNKINST